MPDKDFAALLVLLRAGLWEREPDRWEGFPLSAGAWERIYILSRRQTVAGIVFRGLQFLPDELLPPSALLMRWVVTADRIEERNRLMNRVLGNLYTLYVSRELNPILQKGQGVAQFYACPLLRESGDIDFYFTNPVSFRLARLCMQARGIEVEEMPDRSLSYVWQGVEVEHHTRLFDLHNPFLRTKAARLEERWGYCSRQLSADVPVDITVPAPFLNLLLLNLHILKHALGWGIGLRQLCDMARACHCLHGEVDAREMEAACRSLGLTRWTPLLHAFLVEHLGLEPGCLPYPAQAPSAEPLLDIVRRGGNFGLFLEGRSGAGRSWLQRKWQTSRSFLRNVRFARTYAPREAFWLFTGLLRNNLRSTKTDN